MLHNVIVGRGVTVEQEKNSRVRSFIRELVSDWRPSRMQVLWAVRIAFVFVILLGALTLIGLPFEITLWEWVKLLIIPAMIAGGGVWFNRQQRERELEIAAQQRDREQDTARERAQDEVLQAYLDQIGHLLLDKDNPLRQSNPDAEVRMLARARTLTALGRLDGDRKQSILLFLYEAALVGRPEDGQAIVRLQGADLSTIRAAHTTLAGVNLQGANLREADLKGADLSGARLDGAELSGGRLSTADLRSAVLRSADLKGTRLRHTFLPDADLSYANLEGADLYFANLRKAKLLQSHLIKTELFGANLEHANFDMAELKDADLRGAYLRNAEGLSPLRLRGADLRTADLRGSDILDFYTDVDLLLMRLTGATMPNGQKYEDWLKGKGSGEDKENAGPS